MERGDVYWHIKKWLKEFRGVLAGVPHIIPLKPLYLIIPNVQT